MVHYLVEKGADVNAKEKGGNTALTEAAALGHLEVVRHLVENSADVNAANQDGDTLLLWDARKGHLEMVQCLVKNSADVNANGNDVTDALTEAAALGHLEVVRHLVDNSADVNSEGKDGVTPLLLAARAGNLEVVRFLVGNGADVNAKTVNGITALDVSSSFTVAQFQVNLDNESMQRDWLIPEDQIVRTKQKWRELYELVEWLGAKVFIRSVGSGKQLSKEAKIWHHPHIALMFGACYIKNNPFIVCEYAPNGHLLEYLKAHPNEVWLKLYEAALGLSFLHRTRVFHGELKCRNISIGSDGFAKQTNFSLSSLESLDDTDKGRYNMDLKRESTYESDLYSFGWCIIDAVRGHIFRRKSKGGIDVLPTVDNDSQTHNGTW